MTDGQIKDMATMLVVYGLQEYLTLNAWRWELSVNPHKITGTSVQDYVLGGGHIDPDLVYPNYTFRTDQSETVFKIAMVPKEDDWRVSFVDVTLSGVLKQATTFLDTGARRA